MDFFFFLLCFSFRLLTARLYMHDIYVHHELGAVIIPVLLRLRVPWVEFE